jgi:indolepyruvate ferredoxin oxidoreductase alpha subunit
VICSGFVYQKLCDVLGDRVPEELRVLGIGTFHPLPVQRLVLVLERVDCALVLEETAPLLERATRAAAQAQGLVLPVLGRDTGHVTLAGELLGTQIAHALNRVWPSLSLSGNELASRSMPSQRPFCEDCPYLPAFRALLGAIDAHGGRDEAIIVGDPGCMVRGQQDPWRLLDVKNSLGSSIGTAAGIALGQSLVQRNAGPIGRRVIALTGDSSFLHTGLSGLVDGARLDVPLLVVILDNGTTALTGGQPHPGTPRSARGAPRRAVDLVNLARAAGAKRVAWVDLDRGDDARMALERGLEATGLTVVVMHGECPQRPLRAPSGLDVTA